MAVDAVLFSGFFVLSPDTEMRFFSDALAIRHSRLKDGFYGNILLWLLCLRKQVILAVVAVPLVSTLEHKDTRFALEHLQHVYVIFDMPSLQLTCQSIATAV